MIIAVVNTKGGTGKSTISVNLADAIARRGYETLLIDADPQGSVAYWDSLGETAPFDIMHHPSDTLNREIDRLAKGYKHTVIDGPPGTGDITLSILLAAQLAIVPMAPSVFDLSSSNEMIDLVREARKHNRRLKPRLLIARKVTGTVPARDARPALERYKMPIFQTEVCQRIDYVRAAIEGESVLTYAPHGQAAAEIRALCDEIIGG